MIHISHIYMISLQTSPYLNFTKIWLLYATFHQNDCASSGYSHIPVSLSEGQGHGYQNVVCFFVLYNTKFEKNRFISVLM